jgi:hypothetical protein
MMMRKLTKAVLAGAVALLAMTPASGQTGGAAQTPENAHKFLELALFGTKYSAVGSAFSKVTSAGCYTTIIHRYSGREEVTSIEWSVSRTVAADGALVSVGDVKVYLATGGTQNLAYKIDVGSPEMATRVQKAMEVIRASCDKTQGLGF